MWNGNNNFNNFNPQQYPPTPSTQFQQKQNNIIWAKGRENARSMQLAPNSTVILLDSQASDKFYIKTTDDIGLGKLRVFTYVEQPDDATTTQSVEPATDLSNYITREQFDEVIKEIRENASTVSTIKSKQSPIIIKK